VQEAMALMTAKAVRHLPVLEHKAVIGIASIGDLVKSVIGEQRFIIEQLESNIEGGQKIEVEPRGAICSRHPLDRF
jgi:CBS domain-containing protein